MGRKTCFYLENIWGHIPGAAFPAGLQLVGVPWGSCSSAEPWEGDGETPKALQLGYKIRKAIWCARPAS